MSFFYFSLYLVYLNVTKVRVGCHLKRVCVRVRACAAQINGKKIKVLVNDKFRIYF